MFKLFLRKPKEDHCYTRYFCLFIIYNVFYFLTKGKSYFEE